jgi:ABC-type branched-subunit amino acid transport system substrate-binding protein
MRVLRALPPMVVLLTAACTSHPPLPRSSGAGSPPTAPSASASEGPAPITLDVVASSEGEPYVDGMRLAVADVNATGGAGGKLLALRVSDDRGAPAAATLMMDDALTAGASAILYAGPGSALSPLRDHFARTGTPVVLSSGDLYTNHGLFRQVFQTTIPWAWQAKVIARYLVLDRKETTIAFIGSGADARDASTAAEEALAYWGGRLAWASTYAAGAPPPDAAISRAGHADAVIVYGSGPDSMVLAEALATAAPHAPRVAGGSGLLQLQPDSPVISPGTVACYSYTWAGWAEPIHRVAAFQSAFQAMWQRPPRALEQEGYDAVRALALGLDDTGGKGGSRLTLALERIQGAAFSSFPIDLGPDDHMFLPRDQLGLFAIAGPTERLDPWQIRGSEPWRPLMRTFTSDGTRDNILDRDRRAFFPFWRRNRPGPEYWRSRYGIVTRPKDHLH